MNGQSPPISGSASASDALRSRVMSAIRAEAVPSRAAGARRRALLVVAAVGFSVGVSVAMGRPGLRGRPFAHVASLAVIWALVGTAATWAGVTRGHSMLGRPAGWRIAVASLTPIALLAASLVFGIVWPQTLIDRAGTSQHLLCFFATTAFALGPLAAWMVIRRGSDPVAPRLTGAAIAASAGAWGALGIEMHCRHTSLFHVGIGHVLPVALLVLVGAALGAVILAIRVDKR